MLAGAALVALALGAACGGGGENEPPPEWLIDGVISLPFDGIEGLTNYAFTSDLEISSAGSKLKVTFDGVFEAPDRIQGLVEIRGEPFEQGLRDAYDRPSETEAIIIGQEAWWREPDGAWQPGVKAAFETIDPFIIIREYVSPEFYLEALQFDSLEMPVSGDPQNVNGVTAYPVKLDKEALLQLLPQGTALKLYPDPAGPEPGPVENAGQVLPQDFAVEAWFASKGAYPVRIVFTYSIGEDESCALCWGFERPMEVRLQLDITDPAADVRVQPPPGSQLPY